MIQNYGAGVTYTQAKKIDIGNCYLIFVSGIQPPVNENKIVTTDDIAEQTKMVFEEIQKSLDFAGASMGDIVKAVIYLTNMTDFDIVSKIRAEYFQNSKPVSTLIEVNKFTRCGAKIEIEVTAILPKQ